MGLVEDDLRDRIDSAIGAVLFNTNNHPNPTAALGRDFSDLRNKCVDAVVEVLEAPQSNCGGCLGLGAHSKTCYTQPGALWVRLAAMADSLGDNIGSNDMAAANMAYVLAAKYGVIRYGHDEHR